MKGGVIIFNALYLENKVGGRWTILATSLVLENLQMVATPARLREQLKVRTSSS